MFINPKGLGFPQQFPNGCFKFVSLCYAGHWLGTVYQIRQPFWSLFHTKYLLCVIWLRLFCSYVQFPAKVTSKIVLFLHFLASTKECQYVLCTSFHCVSFVLCILRDKLEFNRPWYYSWKLKLNSFEVKPCFQAIVHCVFCLN